MASNIFTDDRLHLLNILERTTSSLSITGSIFIISSYLSHHPLRTPRNRFAFVIALADIAKCTAITWATGPPSQGDRSPWCQTQGYLIYCFGLMEPTLIAIMITSVYIRIKAWLSVDAIRRFELVATILAFICPLLAGIILLCLRPHGHVIIGSVVTWCLIRQEFEILRVIIYYSVVWTMLLWSLFIVILSARKMLQIRSEVKAVNLDDSGLEPDLNPSSRTSRPKFAPFSWKKAPNKDLSPGTSSSDTIVDDADTDAGMNSATIKQDLEVSRTQTPDEKWINQDTDISFTSSTTAEVENISTISQEPQTCEEEPKNPSPPTNTIHARRRRKSSRWEAAHWKYARFAMLYFFVLYFTWIPTTVNRIYNGFLHPDDPSFAIYVATSIFCPLCGFGGFMIYLTMNWNESRKWILQLWSRLPLTNRAKDRG